MKPWEIKDRRFTIGMRHRILGAIAGEIKAERIRKETEGG